MQIDGTTALVTGANRGIGREFARELITRGARVYATARRPETIDAPGVTPIALDVTDPARVAEVAAFASDVSLLVNNAGISTQGGLVDGDLAAMRAEMETNYYGPLQLVRAFAPVLAANGGGAIVNVLSALSLTSHPGSSAYSASKAAAWAMTNSARLEFAAQGTLVTAVHMGMVDTDMGARIDLPKIAPSEVATAALDAVERDAYEVLVDDTARSVKASLALDPREAYADLLAAVAAR